MNGIAGGLVVVTGAATGVGRALALEAAGRGAEVLVVDVNDTSETVGMITGSGGRASGALADVTDLASLEALSTEVCGQAGAVDLVCANAGTGVRGTIDTLTSESLRQIFDVNVLGAFHTVRAFLPALRRARTTRGHASVLITGSEHSLGVPPHVAPMMPYTTSKHAVLGMAACMRRDLASEEISVSVLCPGYVRTERLRAYADAEPEMAEVLATYGQDSEIVARQALDGVDRGSFVIPTNPASRDFILEFHREIISSVEQIPMEGSQSPRSSPGNHPPG
jgi:NAD(P)-dependent dehydrogenase (short-subunit alcohol dehydrogenase family)